MKKLVRLWVAGVALGSLAAWADCIVGNDGVGVCGPGACIVGFDGHAACGSYPGAQCIVGNDGHAVCG